jgi:hypothetical protein
MRFSLLHRQMSGGFARTTLMQEYPIPGSASMFFDAVSTPCGLEPCHRQLKIADEKEEVALWKN